MRKTVDQLTAEVDVLFADNTVQAITPLVTRGMLHDIIDTYKPGYGIAAIAATVLPALGTTPQIVIYDTAFAETPEYTLNLAQGAITRLAQGLPSTVNRVSFFADVAAPTGDEVVFSLFRDGVDIPGGVTCSGQGLGNFVQAAFSIATTAEDALDHFYDVRATKVTGGADNVELGNVRFIMELIPTIGI